MFDENREIQEALDIIALPDTDDAYIGNGIKVCMDGKYKGLWVIIHDDPSWDFLEWWSYFSKNVTFSVLNKALRYVIKDWNFRDKRNPGEVLNLQEEGIFSKLSRSLMLQIIERIGNDAWSNSKSG